MTWIKMNAMKRSEVILMIELVRLTQRKAVHVEHPVAVQMKENHKETVRNQEGEFI